MEICDRIEKSIEYVPESSVHGANMGPIWGLQDPGGPHVRPMKFAIWGVYGLMDCGQVAPYDVRNIGHLWCMQWLTVKHSIAYADYFVNSIKKMFGWIFYYNKKIIFQEISFVKKLSA